MRWRRGRILRLSYRVIDIVDEGLDAGDVACLAEDHAIEDEQGACIMNDHATAC